MKWLGIGAGVVLAGIVGAVALLPRLVDWNAYRPEIAALAGAAIGHKVVIDGNIRAELFPTPQLTAGRIRVPGAEGDADLAAIRWAEARFKFSDLLRGEVTLTELALIEPTVTLTPDAVGRFPAAAGGAPVGSSDPSLLGASEQRTASRIEIRNGTFTYAQPGAEPLKAERVTGIVETPAVGRRIAVALTGERNGRQLSIDMRLTPPSGDAPAPMAVLVTDTASGAKLRVEGDWAMPAQDRQFTGRFSLDSPTVAASLAMVGGSLPFDFVETGPLRLDGTVRYADSASSLSLTDISFNTEALSATGGIQATWSGRPRMEVTLRVGRLDLDGMTSGASRTDASAAKDKAPKAAASSGSDSPSSSLPLTQAEGQDLMAWIGALPVDMSLDLSVAGARMRDTVVRRITARGTIERGTVTLEELSAQLPGGADLSIAGFGDLTGPEPLLEGNATLRADDLQRLLTWGGLPVPNVSADRLRRFSLVSGLSLRPRRLDIIDAAVELDGVTATASAAVALRQRLGLGLRVTIDHIDLDAYRPVARSGDAAGQAIGGAAALPPSPGVRQPAEDPRSAGGEAGIWGEFDASLDLVIGRAVGFGVPFTDIAGNLVLKDGVLTVNQMTFQDAGGVSGTIGGQLAADGDRDAALIAFEGSTQDLGRLSALMEGPDVLSGFLRSLGPVALKASYQPAVDGPALVVEGEGRDGAFAFGLTPSFNAAGVLQGDTPAVELVSGAMTVGENSLSGLKGRMTFPSGQYQLEKLSGTLNGGTLNVSGSLRRRDDGLRQLLITGALDGLKVDRDLADLDGALGVAGMISIRGQGEATGSDWRAMSALNEGWLDIDGELSMRVAPSRAGIVRVRQVEDVRDALRSGFSRPGSLQGTVRLENSTLTTGDLTLRGADQDSLALTGRLGLDDLALSVILDLRTGDGGAPPARLIAEGPAGAPNLRLERAGPSQ